MIQCINENNYDPSVFAEADAILLEAETDFNNYNAISYMSNYIKYFTDNILGKQEYIDIAIGAMRGNTPMTMSMEIGDILSKANIDGILKNIMYELDSIKIRTIDLIDALLDERKIRIMLSDIDICVLDIIREILSSLYRKYGA